MKKYIPHILGAIFVLVIIGAWMLIAHLVKKPSETQVPMLLIFVNRQYERDQVELHSDFMTDIVRIRATYAFLPDSLCIILPSLWT